MSETTIEWTRGPNGERGYTFNPWVGCTKVSPACDHCYAEAWAKRAGTPGLWDGERRRTRPENWRQPLKWDEAARKAGARFRVFCASLADMFDNAVPDEWREDLFRLILRTPNLDWLLLTKRIGNAERMLPADWGDGYPNVWLGSTVANQEEAERDIPKLLRMPAAVRFLSCEPLLGAIDLRSLSYKSGGCLPDEMRVNDGRCSLDAIRGITTWPGSHYQSPVIKREFRIIDGKVYQSEGEARRIDWVIVGGESGPKSRPSHPDWFRSLRDQCVAARVPFHFKQWGQFIPADQEEARQFCYDDERCEHVWDRNSPTGYSIRVGKKAAGRLLDGRTWDEMPR